jgi:hypothetical protein
MKRSFIVFLGIVAVFWVIGSVFAAWPLNLEGEPVLLNGSAGNPDGYFIWHDGSGIHLRVATSNEKHVFSGYISTDGRFENIMTKSSDEGDFSRLTRSDKLQFQLTTDTKVSGIDWTIFDGRFIRFNLSKDGQQIDINQIYLGKDGWHPSDADFSIHYSDHPEVHEHIFLNWFWWGPWPHPGPPIWHRHPR